MPKMITYATDVASQSWMVIIHIIAKHASHALIAIWSKMMAACAGRLSMMRTDTNKRQECMMDSMTLTSKEEVRKAIIELISIANLTTERDSAIIANARLVIQKLGV